MSDIFRKALLGSAALAVMTTGAAANELDTLKAQLMALQAQVDSIKSAPPADGSFALSYERGHGANAQTRRSVTDVFDENSGLTIAVTPAADLPAPVAEVTVYGYVAGHVSYDFDEHHGDANSFGMGNFDAGSGDTVDFTAFQSRFGIKSKLDTAVGQLRTQIEGDFLSGTGHFRLRHAVGHWDMTPNWTLSIGQTWYTAGLLPIGVSTVDLAGGLVTYSRVPQVRLTYTDGPFSMAVAAERPSYQSNMPNFAGYVQYDISGGHQLIVSGEVADWAGAPDVGRVRPSHCFDGDEIIAVGIDRDACIDIIRSTSWRRARSGHAANDALAFAILAGVNINLAEIATLTAGVGYGKGLLTDKFVFAEGFDATDRNGDPLEAVAFRTGLSVPLTETTTMNGEFSYVKSLGGYDDGQDGDGTPDEHEVYKVNANIMWQPVRQMRMGWEVVWAKKTFEEGEGPAQDGIRAVFGTWFFF